MRRAGPTEQQCLSTCFVKPVSQSPEVEQYWCWIGDDTWSPCAMNIGGLGGACIRARAVAEEMFTGDCLGNSKGSNCEACCPVMMISCCHVSK